MDAMESWVQETYAPLVLTSATPEVERLAQKNNLSFADLLNGFALLEHADTPLRSVNQQCHLDTFNFRFVATGQFAPLPLQDGTRMLHDAVMAHPPSAAMGVDLNIPRVSSVEDVPAYMDAIGMDSTNTEPPRATPWYREFTRALMDSFRCEEYSMMGQPVAMVLAVSSTDGNPRACFEELARHLPPVFQQGLYDPNLPKYFVLVHDMDETEGTGIDPEAILSGLSIASNSAVLRVNSLPVERNCGFTNAPIWNAHPFVRPPLFPANVGSFPIVTESLGALMSPDDLSRTRAFVREFGLRFVVPALEARIFHLNEIVSAMKKGVKNVFKSWLRKPKDLTTRGSFGNGSGANSGNGVIYRSDSIESQTRLLADTAFIVRDYELALQMYRLVRDDYKSDKSVFHCANANEMIALCLLLTKGSPIQMTNALDSANAAYVKISNASTSRLAVRAAVIAGEIYRTLSRSGLFTDYMDSASKALIRGSTMEQGICSAVLMESAAVCDLQSRLPKFRKYGFRMIMAGHVYDSLGHRPHSARCYALARAIYDSSGWYQVEDHINFTLAQQANRLSDPMASINLFLKLIGTGRNSASQQEALLYEFGMIVKEFLSNGNEAASSLSHSRGGPITIRHVGADARELVVKDLCMPELDDTSTVVFAPVNAIGIDREIDGNQTEQDMWKELEDIVVKQNEVHKYASTAEPSPAISGPHINQDARRINNCWLGPVPSSMMVFRNKRNGLRKQPEKYASGQKIYVEFVMKNALSCAVDVENIHLYGKFDATAYGGTVFDVPEASNDQIVIDSVDLQLLPVSEERVRLAICPKIQGRLNLIGVRWSICGGDVHGEHAFDIPGPLLQDTRANREARARAPNTSLIAEIVGPMPWLGINLEQDARDYFVGEIMTMKATITNAGTADLTGLQLCCSDLSLCVSAAEHATSDTLAQYVGASGQIVDLSSIKLGPGESKNLVLWARALRPGRQSARLLFRYHGAANETADKPLYRMVKVKHKLNVLPCLDVSYSVEPSFITPGEYVLGITVHNERRDAGQVEYNDSVQLKNIICVSNVWTLERFRSAATQRNIASTARSSTQLGFQEASTTYFRVLPRTQVASDTVESCAIALNADVSTDDNSEQLPLNQFLCLDNALELVRIANASGADGSGGDGKRGGGFRTIQSVRRENKALKSGTGNNDAAQAVAKKDPQPTTREALLLPSDIDGHLSLVWSAGATNGNAARQEFRKANGVTNLTSIRIRSPLKIKSCPLTVTLRYPDSISLASVGSNSSVSLAETDIIMTVRNDSALTSPPIDFTLEMLHPDEGKTSHGASTATRHSGVFTFPGAAASPAAASPHFFWVGVTKKKITQFAPSAQVSINLKACFLTSGIYDLNRFRFVVQPTSSDASAGRPPSPVRQPVVYEFPVEYLIYVKPASKLPAQPPVPVLEAMAVAVGDHE